jgi:hypothetical protein
MSDSVQHEFNIEESNQDSSIYMRKRYGEDDDKSEYYRKRHKIEKVPYGPFTMTLNHDISPFIESFESLDSPHIPTTPTLYEWQQKQYMIVPLKMKQIKIINNLVMRQPIVKNMMSIISDRFLLRGVDFSHGMTQLKSYEKQIMTDNWISFIRYGLCQLVQCGLLVCKIIDHPDLYKIPHIIDIAMTQIYIGIDRDSVFHYVALYKDINDNIIPQEYENTFIFEFSKPSLDGTSTSICNDLLPWAINMYIDIAASEITRTKQSRQNIAVEIPHLNNTTDKTQSSKPQQANTTPESLTTSSIGIADLDIPRFSTSDVMKMTPEFLKLINENARSYFKPYEYKPNHKLDGDIMILRHGAKQRNIPIPDIKTQQMEHHELFKEQCSFCFGVPLSMLTGSKKAEYMSNGRKLVTEEQLNANIYKFSSFLEKVCNVVLSQIYYNDNVMLRLLYIMETLEYNQVLLYEKRYRKYLIQKKRWMIARDYYLSEIKDESNKSFNNFLSKWKKSVVDYLNQIQFTVEELNDLKDISDEEIYTLRNEDGTVDTSFESLDVDIKSLSDSEFKKPEIRESRLYKQALKRFEEVKYAMESGQSLLIPTNLILEDTIIEEMELEAEPVENSFNNIEEAKESASIIIEILKSKFKEVGESFHISDPFAWDPVLKQQINKVVFKNAGNPPQFTSEDRKEMIRQILTRMDLEEQISNQAKDRNGFTIHFIWNEEVTRKKDSILGYSRNDHESDDNVFKDANEMYHALKSMQQIIEEKATKMYDAKKQLKDIVKSKDVKKFNFAINQLSEAIKDHHSPIDTSQILKVIRNKTMFSSNTDSDFNVNNFYQKWKNGNAAMKYLEEDLLDGDEESMYEESPVDVVQKATEKPSTKKPLSKEVENKDNQIVE